MGHNSADYLHVLTEALKMGYADRDSYYADPAFVDVPATGLLSKAYAQQRAAQIDMAKAQVAQVAGDPLPFDPRVKSWPFWKAGADNGAAEATPYGSSGSVGASGVGRGFSRAEREGGPVRPGDEDPSLKDTTHIAII